MRLTTILASTAGAIATLAISSSAFADAALAQYSQIPGDPGSSLTYTNGTLSTPTGGYATQFSFQAPGLPGGNLDANFVFQATGSGAAYQTSFMGAMFDVQPMTGSFSFTYTGSTPLMVGTHSYGAGTTLLAGTFIGSSLNGLDSGSTGSLTDSRLEGGYVNFTSGISQIQFGPASDEGLSLALNSIVPYLGLSGSNLTNFTATSVGTYAADVTIAGGGGGVPEAGAWIIMVLGFGVAGAQFRAHRAKLANI